MKSISQPELQKFITGNQDFLLVDVLPKDSFEKQHIPGSINVPVKDNPNFARDIENRVKSKTQTIVVYCASSRCNASEIAAQQLEKAGFSNVQRYEEGLEGWFGAKAAA